MSERTYSFIAADVYPPTRHNKRGAIVPVEPEQAAEMQTLYEYAGLPSDTDVMLDAPHNPDDAAWFAAHPSRTHRLRGRMYTIVRQVRPGRRVRLPFSADRTRPPMNAETLSAHDGNDNARTDALMSTLFDMLLRQPVVPLDAIAESVRANEAVTSETRQ
jgi:hypothetical protein